MAVKHRGALQPCHAYTQSLSIESNSTRKEIAPLVHMRTNQLKHKIRERRTRNLPSQRQYLDWYLLESSGHFIFKAELSRLTLKTN